MKTHAQEIIIIPCTTIFICANLLVIFYHIIALSRFACILNFGESLVTFLTELLNKLGLAFLGDDQLIINNLENESGLIAELSVFDAVDFNPMCLFEIRAVRKWEIYYYQPFAQNTSADGERKTLPKCLQPFHTCECDLGSQRPRD